MGKRRVWHEINARPFRNDEDGVRPEGTEFNADIYCPELDPDPPGWLAGTSVQAGGIHEMYSTPLKGFIMDTLTQRATFWTIGHSGRRCAVPTTLTWSADLPYEVVLHLHESRRVVTWVVSRDTLYEGLVVPSGDGDVHVEPGQVLTVTISSPNGTATLTIEHETLRGFLAATFDHVPLGSERMVIPDADDPRWYL